MNNSLFPEITFSDSKGCSAVEHNSHAQNQALTSSGNEVMRKQGAGSISPNSRCSFALDVPTLLATAGTDNSQVGENFGVSHGTSIGFQMI